MLAYTESRRVKMKNISVDALMKMLSKMDQKTLEANLAKAQEILKNKENKSEK